MKCQRCGVELFAGSEDKLCYDCKKKRVKTFQRVGTIGAIGFAVVALAYGISPIDIVPDFIPGGIIDDLIVGTLGSLGIAGSAVLAFYNGMKAKNMSNKE